MALNFSHRQIFPAHLAEDNLVSHMRIANGCLVEGIPERNRDGYGMQWSSSRDVQDLFDYEGDNMDWENVLPADPFGMDISSTVTAITAGLLEYHYGSYGRAEVGVGEGDSSIFAGWNLIFNNAMNTKLDDKTNRVDRCFGDEAFGHPFCDVGVGLPSTTKSVYSGDDMKLDDKTLTANRVDRCFGEEVFSRPFCDISVGLPSTTKSMYSDDDDTKLDDKTLTVNRVDRCFGEEVFNHPFCDISVGLPSTMKSVYTDDANAGIDQNKDHHEIVGVASDPDDGGLHPALSFALGHLGVLDLLSVERVCKSLRFTVQNDPLLWKSIHIDHPLTDRITDDVLLQLTSRAQGNLHCLSLVGCKRVTDEGLRRVLESNMRLIKLCVPGCTKLSIDGIISCLRDFKKVAVTGIKYLRIGGLYGVTQKHFEEVMSILGVHNHAEANHHKLHSIFRKDFYLSCEDSRPIDIDMCPRCQNIRLVFDCPSEICKGKDQTTQSCRGCRICIPRCVHCGTCVEHFEYEETFFLDYWCSYCMKSHSTSNHATCQVEPEPGSSFPG